MSTATAKPKAEPKAAAARPEPFDAAAREKVPTDTRAIRKGHVMLIEQYVLVTHEPARPGGEPSVQLRDLHTGAEWTRTGEDIVARMHTADQFDPAKEVALPKTRLVKVLEDAGSHPFTVCWVKKEGEERTLRGRYVSNAEHDLGYSWVEDLDLAPDVKGGRLRQVDHRTIQWVVLDGVKYVLKK